MGSELVEIKMSQSPLKIGDKEVQNTVSLTPSPILDSIPKTPKSPFGARIMTPLASPMKKALTYMEEIGHFTKLDPQDAWLPITESRNGNAYYAAFHTLSSGIGVQALVLPLAFITLGWIWGIISLSIIFMWQLYTLWLLIQLHESVPGMRYSRYLRLSMAAFGEKLGKILALFPTMYLSGGTCVTLIMIGGGTMKIFFQTICGSNHCHLTSLSTIEWYIVFTVSAIILAQLPNLNSIAGISLVGSISAVTYCTLTWVVSVVKERPEDVSFETVENKSDLERVCSILNAIGMIAFAFRGHNLVLEIQGTMPSSLKNPSHVPMWKGVKFSYSIIALCLFPLAIGGYWAYGNLMPNGGILSALDKYHGKDTSKVILGITSLLVVVHSLTSFQIYAMPVFDNLEFRYTSNKKKPCPWWLRTGFRVFFGCLAFFISVALPFLPSLAGLIGGIALPVTLAYPCLMWIMIKKPQTYTSTWFVNWSLGLLGLVLSVLLVFGAIWTIAIQGMDVHFFKPQ
ncbi:lysine histidine transporter-like 8 [Nicotiana tabacum]|uniref:Lysine histidine transporter-like 8 n=4 Tax=Nicotiana TaxID=4085 RepID=A0AC58SAX0_TOBAC|nr:PREDICTED: lysine histidine transporter-like 8 [Nicotiana sylvestris]XP_016450937.1 PREDICTED: lysine histidine transporter-like 8 [Nicotiana tabacum]